MAKRRREKPNCSLLLFAGRNGLQGGRVNLVLGIWIVRVPVDLAVGTEEDGALAMLSSNNFALSVEGKAHRVITDDDVRIPLCIALHGLYQRPKRLLHSDPRGSALLVVFAEDRSFLLFDLR
jgi:hypothetical protein